MNTELIKKKILDLAIRGKLVEQRPEEGTAEELYAQIQEEKKKLIADGKIKKEKPLPEITEDEIPFDIPESWKWVRLNDVCSAIGDIDHKMPQKVEKGIPYISPMDFTEKGIDYINAKHVSEDDYNLLSQKFKSEKNDIVFPRYGTIGKIRIIDTDKKILISYSCCTIKNLKDSMFSRFVVYVLNSPFIQNSEINRYINKTTQPNVGLQSIKRFLFPLPPLAEQKRIVDKVEEIFSRIDVIEKAKADLAKDGNLLEKKILDLAIRGKLVEQRPEEGSAEELYAQIQEEKKKLIADCKIKKEKPLPEISEDEIPFDIPESWKWVRLSELVSNKTGLSYKKENLLVNSGDKIRVLRGGNIQGLSYQIKSDDIQISKQFVDSELFLKKNMLITPAVTSFDNLGKIARIEKDFTDIVVGGFVLMLTPYLSNDIYSKFLHISLSTDYVKDILKGIANKSGAAFFNIPRKKYENIIIPLAPLQEQERIVAKIEELLPYCDKLK